VPDRTIWPDLGVAGLFAAVGFCLYAVLLVHAALRVNPPEPVLAGA
jgi:hypothetical protein